MLKANMGMKDRLIRALVVTPLLVVAGVLVGQESTAATVLFVLAGVVLGTAIIGWCGVYRLLGIRTCPVPPPTGDDAPAEPGRG